LPYHRLDHRVQTSRYALRREHARRAGNQPCHRT
jgi:hypothetical protein